MTQTNYRREFWQNVYAAYVGAANAVNEKGGANWADFALKALDERFPEDKEAALWDSYAATKQKAGFDEMLKPSAKEFDFEGIQSEAKLLTDLLHSIDGLKKATAPKKEGIDVSGLLEADNIRLRAIVDQYNVQLADYRKAGPAKDIEIERLTREGLIKDQKLKEATDDVKFCHLRIKQLDEMVQLAVRVDEEKDKRIAELEQRVKELLSQNDFLERQLCKESADYEKRIAELEAQHFNALKLIDERNDRIAELEAKNEKQAERLLVLEEELENGGCTSADIEEKDKRIAELENTITSLRQTMEVANDLRAQTISEKNDRVAELEKKIEDLLAPAVVNEPAKARTAIEWLEDLPEPYRSQALANAKCPVSEYSPDSVVKDLADAINECFNEEVTPEGGEYWCSVMDKLRNGEPLVKEEKPVFGKQPTTVKGWLELLEEPYRTNCLKGIDLTSADMLNRPCEKMPQAINYIHWDDAETALGLGKYYYFNIWEKSVEDDKAKR